MPSVGIRVWGNTQLAPERVVTAGTNDSLVINVNGVDYTITLDAGTYKSSHEHVTSLFVKHVNDKLVAAGCPVVAKAGGIHDDSPRTVLIFESADMTEATTLDISGAGATSFIGSAPYLTQPAQVEVLLSEIASKVSVRGGGKVDINGQVGVLGYSRENLEGSITTQTP